MARCEIHCPRGADGATVASLAAAAAGLAALAVFALRYAVVLMIGLNVVALVTAGLYRVARRLTVLLWRGQHSPLDIGRAMAPAAVEAATAPLAIESHQARHIIPGMVISDEISERR